MKLATAQINPIVGDIEYNKNLIIKNLKKAREASCDLLVFPELALTGYPLNDLVYEINFLRQQEAAIEEIRKESTDIALCFGFVDFDETVITHDKTCLKYNAACLIQDQQIRGTVYKSLLPNYDVFHEERYFQAAQEIKTIQIQIKNREVKLGVQICEDLWDEHYEKKVSDILAEQGADILINLSASPFELGKLDERIRLLKKIVQKHGIPFVYCNMIAGQDELIFDGYSFAYNGNCELLSMASGFKEELSVFDLNSKAKQLANREIEDIYQALVLGIRDYFFKNNFQQAILGLSGGIDSALVAILAADALGEENVQVISLPSKYSSQHSLDDARDLAKRNNLNYRVIPIEAYHHIFETSYADWFPEQKVGLADENLQARLRGLILMNFSNQCNRILLSTGNKSELALGYSTLYGDMNGALSVIGDLSKTRVYELSEYINQKDEKERIPRSIIEKEPSAELRDEQVDPFDYNHISPLLEEIIEKRRSKAELLEAGHDKSILDDLFKRIFNSEFKRFQASIVLRVTSKAFGLGRLYPMTNHYKG